MGRQVRVFRQGRVAAASPDEAACRVYEMFPTAVAVRLKPSPEPTRRYEYLVELREEDTDGDDLAELLG